MVIEEEILSVGVRKQKKIRGPYKNHLRAPKRCKMGKNDQCLRIFHDFLVHVDN